MLLCHFTPGSTFQVSTRFCLTTFVISHFINVITFSIFHLISSCSNYSLLMHLRLKLDYRAKEGLVRERLTNACERRHVLSYFNVLKYGLKPFCQCMKTRKSNEFEFKNVFDNSLLFGVPATMSEKVVVGTAPFHIEGRQGRHSRQVIWYEVKLNKSVSKQAKRQIWTDFKMVICWWYTFLGKFTVLTCGLIDTDQCQDLSMSLFSTQLNSPI